MFYRQMQVSSKQTVLTQGCVVTLMWHWVLRRMVLIYCKGHQIKLSAGSVQPLRSLVGLKWAVNITVIADSVA